jgi:hypothetical protein
VLQPVKQAFVHHLSAVLQSSKQVSPDRQRIVHRHHVVIHDDLAGAVHNPQANNGPSSDAGAEVSQQEIIGDFLNHGQVA